MSYEWVKGSRFNADADKVGSELKSLDKVSIDTVLEKAKDSNTELNKCFTWDDSEAANKYRRHEASMLISSILVVVEDKKEQEVVSIRAYESLKNEEDTKNSFHFTPQALKDPDFSKQILAKIEKDIENLEYKFKVYSDLITPEIKARVAALV